MEDIRTKHKTIQNAAHHIALECIHPQVKMPAHGSPYHVHPYPSPIRLQHAFQAQPSPKMFHPKGLKPLFDTKSNGTPNDSPILGRALCLTPRASPLPGRISHLNEKFQESLVLNSDTEALVAKISAMFPTVSETHIKILLKKYYNREAVVISALQVEKHPITTPGPLTASPSASRLHKGAMGIHSALQLAKGVSGSLHGSCHSPFTLTPQGSPLLLRPTSGASSYYGTTKSYEGGQTTKHQSPKMKLKYLKSVFPKAEETLILDVLANKDNNVQTASEELITMGFSKKQTVIIPVKQESPPPIKKNVTLMKTTEERKQIKENFQKKYSSIAERVVSIALESVDYNEERAEQILNAVIQEDAQAPKSVTVTQAKETKRTETPETKLPIIKSSTKTEPKYKSQYSGHNTGPNPTLRQGPKDNLLLEDYMTWNGPNPQLRIGQTVKADGPESRKNTFMAVCGPSGTAKGPAGIAKGSVYNLNKKTTKIVV
ncbi:uncharacterized protein LOC125062835 isoform X3 [Pieris napi]|uniref:uncharacterized protein LOC125062835 isoform X3 n=1 Tax=Pieris napi TaxID=78633 RepID=UPI001FBA4E7B|nr:uncharacterized protein LOC125062835 isoform X3 [Pieris napi]